MNILTTIDYNVQTFSDIMGRKKLYKDELIRREQEVEQYSNRLIFLKDTKTLYLSAVDVLYQESVGVLQDTLDTAMQYIMRDKDYSIKLELEDKRGTKSLNLSLVDNTKGFEVDLTDSVGMGVRTIVSAILKLYYLVNEGSKVLFCDEKWSALSVQYVPYFFEFLQRMCDEKGLVLVLVTHDTRFMPYATRTYIVADGNIREERDNYDGRTTEL